MIRLAEGEAVIVAVREGATDADRVAVTRGVAVPVAVPLGDADHERPLLGTGVGVWDAVGDLGGDPVGVTEGIIHSAPGVGHT